MNVETLATGYSLVKAPRWLPEQRALCYSDVMNGGVYRVDANGRVDVLIPHRRGIGGIVRHARGGLVVSGRNIAYKPLPDGDSVVLLDRDADAGNVGYNDISTDRHGRIYAGSLGQSPVFADGRPPTPGALHLIDLDGSARVVATGIGLTNGLGFSPDGRVLYHSDSRARTVWRYDVRDDGTLSEKTPFVVTARGVPDGLAVAADGSIRVALASGGKGVVTYDATGTECGFVEIPQPMCTSVCFGGDDLRDLYIVSGSTGAATANAGAMYRVRVDVPGLPVAAARVRIPGST